MTHRSTVSKSWHKRFDAQQRALDVPLTTGQRFTRVIHALMLGDEERVKLETIWLVRAARHGDALLSMFSWITVDCS
jgi:hypothetical protein